MKTQDTKQPHNPDARTGAAATTLALLVVAASTVAAAAPAQAQSAKRIVKQASLNNYYAGNDGSATIRMKIVDSQGRSRRREFTVLRKDLNDGGDQLYYVLFSKPADVRKTAFLVKKHTKKDDDRWLYLPGLDLVKRIAAGDKRTSFVGSHSFYEDISGRGVAEDKHSLVKSTATHHVIKSIPKKKSSAEFSSYTVWIDKATSLPSKIEYKKATGKVYRRIQAVKVDTIQGHPTNVRMKIEDLESGGYTLTEIKKIRYDIGLPKDVFSERSLRMPPSEWIK